MKMKFKELPKFWKRTIIALALVVILWAAGLIYYMWISVGELFMFMF